VRNALGVLLVMTGYVVIYYRLLVRHFYQQQFNVKESTFGALFSFPPYGRLDDLGKKYARRYWVAVAIMLGCLLALAYVTDFAAWKLFTAKPT
jgi:hypothetical protein